jgi:hypothetical protein
VATSFVKEAESFFQAICLFLSGEGIGGDIVHIHGVIWLVVLLLVVPSPVFYLSFVLLASCLKVGDKGKPIVVLILC